MLAGIPVTVDAVANDVRLLGLTRSGAIRTPDQ
jgi:hypothetical protein